MPSAPRIVGPYTTPYVPAPDVFPGPDSVFFTAGRTYADWQPNDHTLLRGPDGLWHAFGITHPTPPGYRPDDRATFVDVHDGEWQFFHAISPAARLKDSLRTASWRDLPKVLASPTRPGDTRPIYAPFIVPHGGAYHMLFGPMPMRVSRSRDLHSWSAPEILFEDEPGARDPHVLRHDGRYLLTYTRDDAVAQRTSDDLVHWSPARIVFHMRRSGSPESPVLVHRDGAFYLFWCLWDGSDLVNGAYDHRTQVYRSADPTDFDRAELVAGLQAHAPEVIEDEDGDWFISSAEWPRRGVSIAPLAWV